MEPTSPVHHIAFFGGAFDPPHRGHRAVLSWLGTLPQFDVIWAVPSFQHPFSKQMAPFDDRLAMCALQFQALPKIEISTVERDLSYSYTEPLFRKVLSDHPNYQLTLVIGTDARRDLLTWKNGDALLRDFAILEIPRAGFIAEHVPTGSREVPSFPGYQSRHLRDMLKTDSPSHEMKQHLKNALGESVYHYVESHDLYKGSLV